MKNNRVILTGKVIEEIWEGPAGPHYHIILEVARASGQADILPVYVPSRALPDEIFNPGDTLAVTGEYRSLNQRDSFGSHLKLYVHAREITLADPLTDCAVNNQIHLQGYICKHPLYRVTPKGRKIAELLLAVNRAPGGTAYIPCVAWGTAARFANSLEVGNLVTIDGRIQSRKYIKRISDIAQEERTAYGVSCCGLALAAGDDGF